MRASFQPPTLAAHKLSREYGAHYILLARLGPIAVIRSPLNLLYN
jgi:hypothetical protein